MEDVAAKLSFFTEGARARYARRLRVSVLLGVLIAAILWQTQWRALQPGLGILLIGQVAAAIAFAYRRQKLSTDLTRLQHSRPQSEVSAWFDSEAAFVTRAALLENGLRLIGFMVLAYGFWLTTRQLIVALVLGVVYPLTAYFGMARMNTLRAVAEIRAQKDEVTAHL